MNSSRKHLYIIDASIFIFRYYFTMPTVWYADNGRPTETVYGYALWLHKFLRAEQPQNVVACFDESLGSCFRNDIYPNYKRSRALPDDDLAFQLLACKKITELMGITCHASNTYEADDLIGSFANYCSINSIAYTILSKDKDLGQCLLNEQALLWDYPQGNCFDVHSFKEKFAVNSHQLADLLALMGDASDDIPGVPGIGIKTASALLGHYNSWRDIKENNENIARLPIRGAAGLQIRLKEYESQIDMALRLTTLAVHAVTVDWNATARNVTEPLPLLELAQGLGFPESFIKKIENIPDL